MHPTRPRAEGSEGLFPYSMADHADALAADGYIAEALDVYRQIESDYPDFDRDRVARRIERYEY